MLITQVRYHLEHTPKQLLATSSFKKRHRITNCLEIYRTIMRVLFLEDLHCRIRTKGDTA